MRTGPAPYKYSTRRSFKVGQSTSGKAFILDRVVPVDIRYDKIILSSTEELFTVVPRNSKPTSRTVEQAKFLMADSGRKLIYRNMIKDPDDKATILANPMRHPVLAGRPIPKVKVIINVNGRNPAEIRTTLEKFFPYDWAQLQINYCEVACDFFWEDFDAIDKGVYTQGPRKFKRIGSTKYYGGRRSKNRLCLYNKRTELIVHGQGDPGQPITRLEFRSNIPAKERPDVEEWLDGRWIPSAFAKTVVVDTQKRWIGIKDQEWSMIRRHGISSTLWSDKISRYRKRKIREIAIDHQLFSIQDMVKSVLSIWPQRYLEAYRPVNAYTGKYTNLHGPYASVRRGQDNAWKSSYQAG